MYHIYTAGLPETCAQKYLCVDDTVRKMFIVFDTTLNKDLQTLEKYFEH